MAAPTLARRGGQVVVQDLEPQPPGMVGRARAVVAEDFGALAEQAGRVGPGNQGPDNVVIEGFGKVETGLERSHADGGYPRLQAGITAEQAVR